MRGRPAEPPGAKASEAADQRAILVLRIGGHRGRADVAGRPHRQQEFRNRLLIRCFENGHHVATAHRHEKLFELAAVRPRELLGGIETRRRLLDGLDPLIGPIQRVRLTALLTALTLTGLVFAAVSPGDQTTPHRYKSWRELSAAQPTCNSMTNLSSARASGPEGLQCSVLVRCAHEDWICADGR